MPTNGSKSGDKSDEKDKSEGKRMARKSHHALAPAVEPVEEQLTPTALTKQEFGRRLAAILVERHMSQSDLVRAINAKFPNLNPRFGRDAISTYVNGRSFPTPKSLGLICETLGLTRDQILPNATMQAMNDEHPAFEMRAAVGHPGKAWVRVNRLMRFETAATIAKLINEEDKKDFEEG
jgi:transcriptional regulator with XRE-family HTH domain